MQHENRNEGENYYAILELADFSGIDEIRAAFRRLAKELHPDMPKGSRDKYERVRTAYEILADDSLRKSFDQSLKHRLAQEKKEAGRPKLARIDIATKLEIILAYSTTRPSFKPSFANSCLNQLAEGRKLSPKQCDSIDNIIGSFQIDVDLWLDEDRRNRALDIYFATQKESQPFSAFDPEE